MRANKLVVLGVVNVLLKMLLYITVYWKLCIMYGIESVHVISSDLKPFCVSVKSYSVSPTLPPESGHLFLCFFHNG